jgi:hypothetical protein
MWVWLRKMILFLHICTLCAEPVKRHNKDVHMLEKSVINMICLLLPVSDWPIKITSRGGLLLVLFDVFAVSVL